MRRVAPISLLLAAFACGEAEPGPNACRDEGTEGATAACLEPTLPPEHYVEQALLYFDTLDVDAPIENVPDYHPLVARWEWPPWLLLTGFGAEDMIDTGLSLRELDPSTVPERDCRFFETQPFARCYVVFEYEEGPCPIYEEFTFDAEGRVNFIEAWSDLPGLLPQDRAADPWGEAPGFPRLANRIPGLGNASGSVELEGEAMRRAGRRDPEVADFAERAMDWERAWARELIAADPDFFEQGCGW
ncbi:MAG TPA: hypothetical protein RMG45_13375 [Polyangiaceae bacterium LLY-WYZ-15_(1-7)]|nr:hypothetical protein [Polyangiaceae bacterium LLY-WYZ-15_(1-7)]